MRFVLTRDPEEFAARAEAFLRARIECNVLVTVLRDVRDAVHASVAPLFTYGLDDDEEVRFAALRTPPWFLLTSPLDPSLALELVERWLEADPEISGVNGMPETARAIAAAWAELAAGTTRCIRREAMHELEQVRDPPVPARGQLRVARELEQPLLVQWMDAFVREAGLIAGPSPAMIAARISSGRLFVWDHGGPVSLVGTLPPVARVVRVGPVYTPPEHRNHGYATSAVAAASRRALAQGARRCMLFTDLANPTSNKIYAEVGYRRFADWEEHAFEPRATAQASAGCAELSA